ncbi:MAG TPA: shikimate dehydrogenase, partial [Rhodocyclaceae bacterium]|nr:shikimate dehydrogenase [Rhodocyclaceae bacterium]
SPRIHALFAAQTGQDLSYDAVLAPVDGFVQKIIADAAAGLKGANVTVPFKDEAFRLATRRTARAERAGAVNTLVFGDGGAILGDNTDGAGLVLDLTINHGVAIKGRRVLLLGAGGAVRGVLAPLLAEAPALLRIANRTAAKAAELAAAFADLGAVAGGGFAELRGQSFDLVINGTSASLSGELPALPSGVFAPASTAYDMMYGKGETPFLAFAREQGAGRCYDGLGMLVEQAAEAFQVWRGVRPDVAPVLAILRGELAGSTA